jgi:hypothetical protein
VPTPSLFVVTTSSASEASPGQNITFYVGYGNEGDGVANGVTLQVSASGSCSGGNFTETIGTLNPNTSGQQQVLVTMGSAGTCTVTVTLSDDSGHSADTSATVTIK